jgi:polar amino acid transport system substrate-binding protein
MNNITKVICLTLALLMFGCGDIASKKTTTQLTAYDRVVNSGELKVGYVPYPPGLIKDPNTGQLSGIFYETLEATGKALGIKIVWKEEVTWGTMIEGLKTKRYDLIGSPVWANSTRGKFADFTTPLYLSGIGAYVRSADNKFSLENINNTNTRISTIDGEMSKLIADNDFPNASQVSLPQMSDVSQMLLEVETKKADVTFVEPYIAEKYLLNKGSVLVNIAVDSPVRIFPNSYMLNKGETDLKSMLDIAIHEQINLGYVEKLMVKYTGSNTAFYLPASHYKVK